MSAPIHNGSLRSTLAAASVLAAAVAVAGLHYVTVTAVPGHAAPAYGLCQEEDGSTPGQSFPCAWNGGDNRQGRTYVLDMPVCTTAQVAVSDAFQSRGLADPIAGLCEDLESQTGSF
jgi:hypothetical protein